MNETKARKIITDYYRIQNPSEEENFQYIEALEYLIKVKNNSYAMLDLGAYYYRNKDYELAKKYYELASMHGVLQADINLGYVWYYGRTGVVDYKKAFEYFSKGLEYGDYVSTYKVADMYKNGYYVDKDLDKYREIIDLLFERAENDDIGGHSGVEVYLRYADAHKNDDDLKQVGIAINKAYSNLYHKLCFDNFFGDYSNMKWCVELAHEIMEDVYPMVDGIDLYDLYVLFKKPFKGLRETGPSEYSVVDTHKVSFSFEDKTYFIEAYEEDDGNISVKFEDKWYRSVHEFMLNAKLADKPISYSCPYMGSWEVVWDN